MGEASTAELIRADIAAALKLTGGRPHRALWDARLLSTRITLRGWKIIVDEIGDVITALAIVENQGAAARLGKFPAAIGSLLIPVEFLRSPTKPSLGLPLSIPKTRPTHDVRSLVTGLASS